MRDYLEHHASSYGSLPGTGILARFWRNWQAHRNVTKLERLDDHMLRDIGITRDDLRWAEALPLTSNAALALEERGRVRRAGKITAA